MGLFGRKKKNPFGLPETYNTPGIGDGLPQGGSMDTAPANPSWLEGGKFTGRDAIGMALAAIGDVAALQNGGQASSSAMILGQMQQNRRMQQEQAQAQRKMADTVGAYQKAFGLDPETAAIYARAGINPKDVAPDKPAIIRDAEAWATMTPEQRKNYQALKDAQAGPVTITLPNGQLYSGPRDGMAAAMGGRQQGGLPTAPVGPLTILPDETPTIQNTPAPQTGANGFPAELTPDQYRATVNALGKAQTDEWMRRNNIRIGGR